MWPDNETERDFLNFTGVADAVAEIIVQAEGQHISIGVSVAWHRQVVDGNAHLARFRTRVE